MITLAQADTIVRHALEHARARELPPMTVAVLDSGGHLVAFDDEIVGAVGVSGHQPDLDDECAVLGITAADLRADPGVS